ncbi:unnamed protein product [Rotaria socialis]|uniref:NAD(P)(+)--arginine ADP-ribosyltransferase n=1 Tax=Rotaria socialis TaxID=392032 RepID=A0A820PG02_9BILA|nr:unnamed protein product [Rotaria socialis]CAF4476938.1 unnamed protein product [Rotaria socialis]CAF4745400.1 unnamed protein product [Rotaria socialis]
MMAAVDEPRLLDCFSGFQTFVTNPFNDSSNGSRFVATWFQRYCHASLAEKAELVAKGFVSANSYKQAIGTIKAWNGFSSASKNRSVAEAFGTNVLFIIDTNPDSRSDHSIDISSYSQFPDEQEVLIRAGRNFRIEKVERLDSTNKYLIYLTII